MTEKIYPIYVIYGKDRHGTVDAYGEVVDLVLQDADRQVSLSVYEPTVELATVLDDAQTLPFLSPRKLVTVEDADSFITAMFDVVKRTVKKGEDVSLVGFGTFTKIRRAARTGVNPSTGERIKIKAKTLPKFRPGKAWKEMF